MDKVDVFVGPMIGIAATFRETRLNFRFGPSYTRKKRQVLQVSPSGRHIYLVHTDSEPHPVVYSAGTGVISRELYEVFSA